MVQLLLDKGADIHARTRRGKTPEDLASALGHVEVAKHETRNPKPNTINHKPCTRSRRCAATIAAVLRAWYVQIEPKH